jgi:catalase
LTKEELMPLPSDEKIVQLANDLLAQFDAIFGLHPGFRPAHAKGMMLSGTFVPDSNPRGLAIRFYLADRVHTDIVSHSLSGIREDLFRWRIARLPE